MVIKKYEISKIISRFKEKSKVLKESRNTKYEKNLLTLSDL